MKIKLLALFRFVSLALMLMLVVTSSGAILSGCGGSADAAKKEKSKKKKSVEDDEEEEEEETPKESEKTDESNKAESEESKQETEEKESSEKDSTSENKKHDEKDSDKDHKTDSKSKHKDKKGDKEHAANGEQIWNDLMKGNARYVSGKHTNIQFASMRKQLAKGQKPDVIILGCADSRVPPELVFDKNLGELFVVRAAGNIADSVELGSIEYAIEHLHSKVLVVLGHESCGAVAAAVSNEKMPTKNLSAIVNQITPAFEGSKSCPLGGKMNNSCVELNVQQSAKDVLLNSPIIKKAVEEGEITLIRAVYQLESGKVVRLP